jgi:DNA-binding XRE family transcriptional regulator
VTLEVTQENAMGYVTGEQFRAARAMLGWEQAELAEKAGVSLKTIKRLEATSGRVEARSEWGVKKALELGGIEFVGEHDWKERTDGVQFSKDPTGKIRRAVVKSASQWLDINLQLKTEKDRDFFERPTEEIVEFVMTNFRDGIANEIQNLLNKPA